MDSRQDGGGEEEQEESLQLPEPVAAVEVKTQQIRDFLETGRLTGGNQAETDNGSESRFSSDPGA